MNYEINKLVSYARVRGESAFYTWLHRIAENVIKGHFR